MRSIALAATVLGLAVAMPRSLRPARPSRAGRNRRPRSATASAAGPAGSGAAGSAGGRPGAGRQGAALLPERQRALGGGHALGPRRARCSCSSPASRPACATCRSASAATGSSPSPSTSCSSPASSSLLDLPLAYYADFVRQHAYGLSEPDRSPSGWATPFKGWRRRHRVRRALPLGPLPAAAQEPAPLVALHRPARRSRCSPAVSSSSRSGSTRCSTSSAR